MTGPGVALLGPSSISKSENRPGLLGLGLSNTSVRWMVVEEYVDGTTFGRGRTRPVEKLGKKSSAGE